MLLGIDVSHHKGRINWQRVAASGVRFAFIKATESTWFVDSYLSYNLRAARAAGLQVGLYHFFRANADGIKQAEHFLRHAGDLAGQLRPVLDMEDRTGSVPRNVLRKRAHAWLERVQREIGAPPIIYADRYYIRNWMGDSFIMYPLWLAAWQNRVPGPVRVGGKRWDWVFWQYTDRGACPGIRGGVDKNRFRGDEAQLQRYIVGHSSGGYYPGPVKVVMIADNGAAQLIDCDAELVRDRGVRCALRPLAEALGYEVVDHIPDQRKVYVRVKS